MAIKYKTYESFSQILHDMPHEPVIVSIVIASLPFIAYIFWKKSSLRIFFIAPAALLYRFWLTACRYTEKRALDERISDEYELIAGKKLRAMDVLRYGGYLGIITLGVLILKKALFLSIVVSQSMMPTLMVSDLVVVESLTSQNIDVGDIIVFRPSGYEYSITHRVVSINDGKIRTQGDNVPIADGWVLTSENIEGKLVSINGRPIVIKNIGTYFMPGDSYILSSDPTYDLIKTTVQTVHTYGPMILIILLLLILMSTFEGKSKYRRVRIR